MMVNVSQSKKALKAGIYAFLLTFIFVLGIISVQYISNFGADIFGKNIDILTIIKICLLGSLCSIPIIFPISVLVMAIIYYRELFKQEKGEIKFKRSIFPATIFATACFFWVAFIGPLVNVNHLGMLYEVRMKSPDGPMGRTDLSLFKEASVSKNYTELSNYIDSSAIYCLNNKKDLINIIKANADEYQINELLKDKSAQILGLSKESFNFPIDSSFFRGYAYGDLLISQIMTSRAIKEDDKLVWRMKIEKAKMIGLPITIFILFYTGMFLGILNRSTHLVLLLAGVYFSGLPTLHYASFYFEKLSKEKVIAGIQGQLYFISIILLITIGLYFYAKAFLKRNLKSCT